MGSTAPGVLSPRSVLAAMDLPVTRLRRVAHRANTHWLVDTPSRRLVLRRYGADRSRADVAYELRLLAHVDARGWPVPLPVAPLVEASGAIWVAFGYQAGRAPRPRTSAGSLAEQRQRGQLLAQLHSTMEELTALGQRAGWRQAHEGLFDRTGKPPIDAVLGGYEQGDPEGGRILRTYTERMREQLNVLIPDAPAPVVIHGDFTPWNLRYRHGMLSGVLDFDAAHRDLRVADFALAWRGCYAPVISGYTEVTRLEPVEHALVVPIFWAWIIASAIEAIDEHGTHAKLTWAVRMLLRTTLTQGEWNQAN